MKLYHGSKQDLSSIEKRQAGAGENIAVPDNEKLDAIYLTPNYGFALACAVRPDGVTKIDDETKTITFENPELFNSESEVFVYEFDIDNIPKENIISVDENQIAIINIDKLEPINKKSHKAKEIEQYYKLKNCQEKPEELGMNFKIR